MSIIFIAYMNEHNVALIIICMAAHHEVAKQSGYKEYQLSTTAFIKLQSMKFCVSVIISTFMWTMLISIYDGD